MVSDAQRITDDDALSELLNNAVTGLCADKSRLYCLAGINAGGDGYSSGFGLIAEPYTTVRRIAMHLLCMIDVGTSGCRVAASSVDHAALL